MRMPLVMLMILLTCIVKMKKTTWTKSKKMLATKERHNRSWWILASLRGKTKWNTLPTIMAHSTPNRQQWTCMNWVNSSIEITNSYFGTGLLVCLTWWFIRKLVKWSMMKRSSFAMRKCVACTLASTTRSTTKTSLRTMKMLSKYKKIRKVLTKEINCSN